MQLHDERYRTEILRRIKSLRPDSQRRWGKMSVAQMLWHVNESIEGALGRLQMDAVKLPIPLPRPVVKFAVLNLPWGKSAPTVKQWLPEHDRHDFAAERDRCVRLIDELTSKSLTDQWPASPTLGPMTGNEVSRLHAKHLDHHLKQFGA